MSCTAGKSAPSRLIIKKFGGPNLVKQRQTRSYRLTSDQNVLAGSPA